MRRYPVYVLLLVLLMPVAFLKAEVSLPALVSDGMVLQRDVPLKIRGWADPGEKVLMKFRGKTYRTRTGTDGEWEVSLEPMEAGGPYAMQIQGNNRIEIADILIGDVWLCAGQSNMDHYLGRHAERYAREIASSENPMIRQLLVSKKGCLDAPAADAEMSWEAATPESVLDFTVVGYFFARMLNEKYQVPVGIIKAAVGGTRIESWTSEEGLSEFPALMENIERNRDTAFVNQVNREAAADRESKQVKGIRDRGLLAEPRWYEPGFVPLNWKPIHIPGYWEDQGIRELDGVLWYRREVELPAYLDGMEARVKLGRIVDADELYVNGVLVGNTTYQYPQREYTVPAGILNAGKNLLVVRVSNQSGKGGFIPDKPYWLLAGSDSIDLKGTWQYRVGEVFTPVKYKQGIRAQDQPAALFNGMIAPLTSLPIRGVLWYQGESNASDPASYRHLLPALIRDWRAQWEKQELPFLIAQLPGYMEVDYQPAESQWAEMREVQLKTALADPRVGLGINIDLGEWNDIHPGAKKPVGERLALQALALEYGESGLLCSGPVCSSHRREGSKVILSFDHVGSGLISGNGEDLSHFALAGADGIFRWARAEIRDDELVVWCEELSEPAYLRYAWADNPDFANLYNQEGLPASPFQIKLDQKP